MNSAIQADSANAPLLLNSLVPHIIYLNDDQVRHDAFARVLCAVAVLPSREQVRSMEAIAKNLQSVHDETLNEHLFVRLKHLAFNASDNSVAALRVIVDAIAGRPFEQRAALFNEMIGKVSSVPANQRSSILLPLASYIEWLRPNAARTVAYDAVFQAVCAIPENSKPAVAAELFYQIRSLHDDDTRLLRFVTAIEFVGSQSIGSRREMIYALQNIIWHHPDAFTVLHCLDDFLALSRSQPSPFHRQNLLRLFGIANEEYSANFRFSIARKLVDEITTLSIHEQALAFGTAAAHTVRIGSPYIEPMIVRVMRQVQALPGLQRVEAMAEVTLQFESLIDAIDFDPEEDDEYEPDSLPDSFFGVLETTEYLPDDLRIHVLTRVKTLLDRCPPALMLIARQTLADAVNVLPIALINRLTSLQPA